MRKNLKQKTEAKIKRKRKKKSQTKAYFKGEQSKFFAFLPQEILQFFFYFTYSICAGSTTGESLKTSTTVLTGTIL